MGPDVCVVLWPVVVTRPFLLPERTDARTFMILPLLSLRATILLACLSFVFNEPLVILTFDFVFGGAPRPDLLNCNTPTDAFGGG